MKINDLPGIRIAKTAGLALLIFGSTGCKSLEGQKAYIGERPLGPDKEQGDYIENVRKERAAREREAEIQRLKKFYNGGEVPCQELDGLNIIGIGPYN